MAAWLTAQQRAALRHSSAALAVRASFPEGVRVAGWTGERETGEHGTVIRHIPGTGAQGGVIVVAWDNGQTGRHSAGSLHKLGQAVS